MPEAPTLEPSSQTPLQAEISAKTAAAVQDTGYGKDFDAEVDAAIAKGQGLPPPKIVPTPEPAPKKEVPKTDKPAATTPVADIPEALLAKKDKGADKEKGEATDAEREKFIKEQTAGLSPKAADRFRAIEAKAYAAEQKAAKAEKLEKELTTVREQLQAVSTNTEAEALKKQIEELDAIVQKNALTEHPKFRAAFDAKIATEVSIASKIVPKEASAEVEALLSLPETAQRNRRLNEIAAELEPLEATKFHAAVDRADRLSGERTAELNNWKFNKTKLSELAAKEGEQAVAQRQSTVDAALKAVLPKFTNDENGVELFRKVDGNEEWNKAVEARLENVKKLTNADLGREDIAEMAAWAMSGAEYRKLFLTQRVLVSKLQEEIAALKGGEPDLGEGGAAVADDDEKGGMLDVVTRIAQKAGAVR